MVLSFSGLVHKTLLIEPMSRNLFGNEQWVLKSVRSLGKCDLARQANQQCCRCTFVLGCPYELNIDALQQNQNYSGFNVLKINVLDVALRIKVTFYKICLLLAARSLSFCSESVLFGLNVSSLPSWILLAISIRVARSMNSDEK